MENISEKNWAIVDDDTIFQYSIRRLIQSVDQEIKITSYYDGSEFLAFLKSQNDKESKVPTEVLMDINMPMMDAWSFLEEFEKLEQFGKYSFRIHLMTSSISSEDRKSYEQKGYLGHYIIKPIKEDDIRKIISG
jgi:CheY-like chemotaxis protein